jgi:hypothetical protein
LQKGEEEVALVGGGANYQETNFRPRLIRALKYYQKRLNSLANNPDIIQLKDWQLRNYFLKTAEDAGVAAKEMEEVTRDVTIVIEEEKYRLIVHRALTFYIGELRKSKKIVSEQLGEDHPIVSNHDSEIEHAKILKNE